MAWPIILLALASIGIQAQAQIWEVMADHQKMKCHLACKRGGCRTVADQTECLNRAVEAGHYFYSYRSYDRQCITTSWCSSTPASLPWHSYQMMWPEFKPGNYKCHLNCKEDDCVEMNSKAMCQSWAVAKNHKFYSYRDADGMCSTSYSCSQLTKSAPGPRAWHSFKAPEAEPSVWSMVYQGGYHKCHTNCKEHECVVVANQAECLGRALFAGHMYYSYRSVDKKCSTSETCVDAATPTKTPWYAYQRMGSKLVEGTVKCHRNCQDDDCFPVPTRGECQSIAQKLGHKYYSFRSSDKMCSISNECDEPIPAKLDWHAYRTYDEL